MSVPQQNAGVGYSPGHHNTLSKSHNRSPSFLSGFRKSNSAPAHGELPMQQPPPPAAGPGSMPGHYPQQSAGQLQVPQPQSQPQPQYAAPMPRRVSISSARLPYSAGADLHPEIKSVVALALAHAHKVYFSGPLVRQIERLPDGSRPAKDELWSNVWAQLGGTTLSIWDMKAIEEASKRGEEVPPAYINVTDAFVQVLGSVTIPATPQHPAQRYTNVLTLNTAGSNLLLFSCPNAQALVSWASALRLAAWEKSRLEEIYTAHLLRMSLSENNMWREPNTSLVKGKLEGWGQIRIAGQTDWKRVWMILSAPDQPGASTIKRNRLSAALFSRSSSPPPGPNSAMPTLFSVYLGKPKKNQRPLLSLRDVTQSFAVFPERPELINRSTLIKIEGRIGDEEAAQGMKGREGWVLIMPEVEGAKPGTTEMLRWVVGFHDAFGMYGRPHAYTWDPRDPVSMMFAYPVGPHRDHLFLDRELSEGLDPRDDRTSVVRSKLINVLIDRMRGPLPMPPGSQQYQPDAVTPAPADPILGANPRTSLSPIVEAQSVASHSLGGDLSRAGTLQDQNRGGLPAVQEKPTTTQTQNGPGKDTGSHLPTPTISSASHPVPVPAQIELGGPAVRSSPKPTEAVALDGYRSVPVAYDYQNSYSAPAAGDYRVAGSSTPPQGPKASPHMLPPIRTTDLSRPAPKSDPPAPLPAAAEPPASAKQAQAQHHAKGSGSSNEYQFDNEAGALYVLQQEMQALEDAAAALPSSAKVPLPTSSKTKDFTPSGSNYTPPVASGSGTNQIPVLNIPPRAPPAAGVPMTARPSTDTASSEGPEATNPDGAATSKAQLPRMQTPIAFDRLASSSSFGATSSGASSFVEQPGGYGQASGSSGSGAPGVTAPGAHTSGSRISLGRKPSGARPLSTHFSNTRRPFATEASRHDLGSLADQDEEQTTPLRSPQPPPAELPPTTPQAMPAQQQHDDYDNSDALAALQFMERMPSPPPVSAHSQNGNASASPSSPSSAPASDTQLNPPGPPRSPAGGPGSASGSTDGHLYKSSFAPSTKAAARRAEVQARQEAASSAISKPGRPNGRKAAKKDPAAWGQSSDEEDEEDEEDDDDDGSDVERKPPPRLAGGPTSLSQHSPAIVAPQPQTRSVYGGALANSPSYGEFNTRATGTSPDGHLATRAPRTLPAIPQQQPRRDESPRRMYPEESRGRLPDQRPYQKQTMWSTVLDPSTHNQPQQKDTFVTLEPNETLTKAFTQQGLLKAGMQDKQDRSAKRQEELARETGASLINVPNKPPPPQSGLLGAITAHERDRKREGGVGAALTERERERRLAEERQRKLDDLQQQQLNHMQGGSGSAYDPYGSVGAHGFPGYNPMMMPMMPMMPMMTGYNPMMTPGAGLTPQQQQYQMWAAQAVAAQAYQHAMMSFSHAGSVAPSEAGGHSGVNTPAAGAATPPQMDPRASMMWGGMAPGMMSPGMNPGMMNSGMNPGMMNPGMMPSMPMMNPMFGMMGSPGMGGGMGGGSQIGVPTGGMSPMGAPAPTAGHGHLQPQTTGGNNSMRHAYTPTNGSPLAPPRHIDDPGYGSNAQSPVHSSPRQGPVS